MKRIILSSQADTDGGDWDFSPDTDFSSLPPGPRFAGSGLFGFDGVLTNNLHEIDNVEHLFKIRSGSNRSDVYIASGPAYFDVDTQYGDTVYAVAGIRSDLYPTRVYKFYDYADATDKANKLLMTNKHSS